MLWYLVGLIILVYLINRLTLDYGFRNLTYRMEIKKGTAEVGEEIEITSIIENKKPLTVSFLKVFEKFPKGFNKISNIYTLFIMPYQRVRRTYKMHINKRGRYFITDVELEIGDFIGFKTDKQKLSIENEIIVFPMKAKLENSLVPLGSLNGDVSVKRWIIDDPLMTIGIREYTGNEPERYIHWPSSLKYGELMVKNFDFTTDNSVVVVLNVETMKPCWKAPEEELIEKVISLARTVIEEFEELRIPYGFATNAYNVDSSHERGYFYHPGLGQSHLDNLLRLLGKIDYRLPSFFETTIMDISKRQGNYTTAVIITPRILDTYIGPINLLSKSVSRTVVISVEEEHLEKLNNKIIKYRSK
ncbi:protein of unknown function DUF58 [Proteiniborus sp. DW1]|uniref:DUF58 domain-containing protein n=1 Tax=Proteiniborus sp. DW1 TaxID=1889883 RepID=UPI00092DEC62|nr:DUF58 domain-containing protein [Proteiniborus sp. DW1]SCG82793.1 protein of unknown function DUF58 [Proteiniborus sp. DW1]